MAMNIVLVEPEIPPNTGNIARTCAATNTSLHLIKPLGFSLDDKYLKRAGLDYWDLVDLHIYNNIDEFFSKYIGKEFFFATTKGKKYYTDVVYSDDCFILFGKETAGLPKKLLKEYEDRTIKIPMVEEVRARSLNLSNSANIILFEALRQNNFKNLL